MDMGPGGMEAKKPSMEQRTEEAKGGTRLGAEMLLQFWGWGRERGMHPEDLEIIAELHGRARALLFHLTSNY